MLDGGGRETGGEERALFLEEFEEGGLGDAGVEGEFEVFEDGAAGPEEDVLFVRGVEGLGGAEAVEQGGERQVL